MSEKRVCKICGKVLLKSQKKFCSVQCRYSEDKAQCLYCGEDFKLKSISHKYCDLNCRAEHKLLLGENLLHTWCLFCRDVIPYKVKEKPKNYCSKACKLDHQKEVTKNNLPRIKDGMIHLYTIGFSISELCSFFKADKQLILDVFKRDGVHIRTYPQQLRINKNKPYKGIFEAVKDIGLLKDMKDIIHIYVGQL